VIDALNVLLCVLVTYMRTVLSYRFALIGYTMENWRYVSIAERSEARTTPILHCINYLFRTVDHS